MKNESPLISFDIESRGKTWPFPQAAVKKWTKRKKKKKRQKYAWLFP